MAETPKNIKIKVEVDGSRAVQHLRMMAAKSREMAEAFDQWADGIESGTPGWSAPRKGQDGREA